MASLKYFNTTTNQWEVIKTDTIGGVIPNSQTWTAQLGQTTFTIANGQIADPKLITVFVDGKARTDFTMPSNTTIQFNGGLDSGSQVFAQWFEVSVPATIGHHQTHEIGGQDAIDVTKLTNYSGQIATPLNTAQTNITNLQNTQTNHENRITNIENNEPNLVPYTGATKSIDLNGHPILNGAKEIIKVDSNGTLSFPNQPNELEFTLGFNSLSANVETTIPYLSGGNFDSSGVYHVSSAGTYLFLPSIYLNLTNSTASLNHYKNNQFMWQLDTHSNFTGSTENYVLHGAVLEYLNVGDTVKFTAISTINCNVNATHTLCSVIKVS